MGFSWSSDGLIANGKALAQVMWALQLINDGHGQIGDRDLRRGVAIHQQLIAADAELPAARAGLQQRRWRDKAPGQCSFSLEQVESLPRACCASLVYRRRLRGDRQMQ